MEAFANDDSDFETSEIGGNLENPGNISTSGDVAVVDGNAMQDDSCDVIDISDDDVMDSSQVTKH